MFEFLRLEVLKGDIYKEVSRETGSFWVRRSWRIVAAALVSVNLTEGTEEVCSRPGQQQQSNSIEHSLSCRMGSSVWLPSKSDLATSDCSRSLFISII